MQEENMNQEAELETNEETDTEEVTDTSKDSKKDPLDEITDLDALRKEAKGYRSIANRLSSKKVESNPVEKETISTSEFVTKKDLEVQNERLAKKTMTNISDDDSDAVKTMKQAINENWDDISAYYVNRSGREEPEQIAKDIRAAYILWADENGEKIDLSAFTATSVLKGGGGKPPQPKKEEDPRFKLPKSPKDWYKKD